MRKLFLILLCFWSMNTYAMDGNTLIEVCNDALKVINNNYQPTSYYKASGQNVNFGACIGYISAVNDTYSGVMYCPPKNFTGAQAARIVTKYLNNKPENLNLPADLLVGISLQQAFPCSKPSGK